MKKKKEEKHPLLQQIFKKYRKIDINLLNIF